MDDWNGRAFGYLKRPSYSSCTDHGVQDRPTHSSGTKYVPQNAASGFASTTASRSASLNRGHRPSFGLNAQLPPSAVEPGRSRIEQDGNQLPNHVRPQPSSESVRSRYSTDSVVRPWWRGGSIRRYNSKSSHRADAQHEVIIPPQEIDLNRALPPLPSLSSWKPDNPRHEQKDRHADHQASQAVSHECSERPAEKRRSVQKTEAQQPNQIRHHSSKADQKPKQSSTRGTTEHGSAIKDSDSKHAWKIRPKIAVKGVETAKKQEITSPSTKEKKVGKFKQQLSKMSLAGFRLHRSSSKRNAVAIRTSTTAALIEAR